MNGAGAIGFGQKKKIRRTTTTTSHHININSRWITDLNFKTKTSFLKKKKERKKERKRSSHNSAVEMNPTRNHEVAGLVPGYTQWVEDPALP